MRKYRSPRYRKETPEKPENFVNDKREYYRKVYLKSDHWKDLRGRKIKACPKCEKCSKKTSLDVHHLNYKNLYDVELEDLQVLCRRCHSQEHKSEKISKQKVKKVKAPNVVKLSLSLEEKVSNDLTDKMSSFKEQKKTQNIKYFNLNSLPETSAQKPKWVENRIKGRKKRAAENDEYIKNILDNLNK